MIFTATPEGWSRRAPGRVAVLDRHPRERRSEGIVIPEAIDAIRALSGRVSDAGESMRRTNASLGIRTDPLSGDVGRPERREAVGSG